MILALLLAACARPTHETLPVAEALAAQGVAAWPADAVPFDWIPTVWAYGLWAVHEEAWVRAWLEAGREGYDPDSSDALSPALLAALAGDEAIVAAAHAYLETAPRTSQGAIAHWGTDRPWGTTTQVWLDSQFMFGLFLLEEGELDLWTEQYLLFSALCRDPDDALYRHAYDDATGENIPSEATYWARGNAWVLVSAAERLALGDDDEVAALFRGHAEAVIAAQAEDGLWRTVLTGPPDPANYTETSASALIAYALARGWEAGALDDDVLPVIAAARAGLDDRVRARGDGTLEVRGTSYGTNPGDYAYYVSIPVGDDLMLGVGAVVMAYAALDAVPVPR